MWSFNRDAEVDPHLKEEFSAAMGIDEMSNRKRRRDPAGHARVRAAL